MNRDPFQFASLAKGRQQSLKSDVLKAGHSADANHQNIHDIGSDNNSLVVLLCPMSHMYKQSSVCIFVAVRGLSI